MVKATIKSKGKLMELEGDMILGTAFRYDASENSEVFVAGDVIRPILPVILAANAAVLLKEIFSGKELEKACADFHTVFLTAAEAAREEEK